MALLTSTLSTPILFESTTLPLLNRTNSVAELTKSLIPNRYQIILLSFAYGIISLLALIGNASIIYIVVHNRRMHSVTNYFICNLALADCLVACFAIPFQVHRLILFSLHHSPSLLSFSFKLLFYRNGFYLISSVN